MRRYSKKADLSISINAIVIIVLAMTFLGLGLTFVRGMFKNIGETTTKVSEQIEQQILYDLRRGDKKLSFPQEEVSIEGGKSTVIAIGIKNTGASEDYYCIELWEIAGNTQTELGPVTSATSTDPYGFYWDTNPQHLSANEANVYGIKLFTDPILRSQTKLLKVVIMGGGLASGCGTIVEYTSKTFFVNGV